MTCWPQGRAPEAWVAETSVLPSGGLLHLALLDRSLAGSTQLTPAAQPAQHTHEVLWEERVSLK